jgi:hypothetical protein
MMDFDFSAGMAWRDAVLIVAALIGAYVVLTLLWLLLVRLKRRASSSRNAEPAAPIEDAAATPELRPRPAELAVAPAPAPDFARELARSSVELEVESLRRESAHLRAEVARLAEEVSQLRATQNVSPLYNEAMALAQQGMTANGIAGRCGISIGEAELVAAMARSASQFDRQELGEEHHERNTNSGNRPRG